MARLKINCFSGFFSESIEWLVEDQAFLAVVWFGSSPTPLPWANCLSFSVFLRVAGRAYWRERGGGGVVEEPNHKTARESMAFYKLFNTLLLFTFTPLFHSKIEKALIPTDVVHV